MAVDVNLNNITSGYNVSKINQNFQRIEEALQDTLGRSGDGPNQLLADVDMNSNSLLNVDRIDVQEFYMDGQPIASIPGFEAIIEIAPQVLEVAAIADEIVAVANNQPSITVVGNNIDAVTAAGDNIPTIVAVNTNAADISTVADNIADVVTVATNIDDILGVEEDAQIAIDAAADAVASAAAAAASEAAVALAGVPTGTIIMRFGPLQPGFIAWGEGGTFDRATYPGLASWLDTNGTALGLSAPQIAAGTIPDWRDYSPRTAGGALGPAVGALQEDAGQRIQGSFSTYSGTGVVASGAVLTGAFGTLGTSRGNSLSPVGGTGYDVTFDSALAARTATETRVKSFGVRWQIKAAGAVADVGTVSIMALAAQVTDNTNRIAVLEAIGKPFTKEYVSAEQAITAGGLLTLTHGLGAVPKLVVAEVVCKTAENGFSVGDVITMPAHQSSSSVLDSYGMSVRRTSTQLLIRVGVDGGPITAIRADNGSAVNLTFGNWRLILRAFA